MTELAPLLVRWLTHDLASPVATALTASELLGDRADAEINGLVQEATRHLAGRLKLIRTALAPGEGALGDASLRKLLTGGLGEVALDWQRSGDCTGAEAALIAGAALLMADLRRGQGLVVGDARVAWGTDWAWPPAISAALSGAPPADPRAALAAMLATAAARAGWTLRAEPTGLTWRD